jgi:RHS repeat-associated protein
MNKNTGLLRSVSAIALLGAVVLCALFHAPAARAANGQCKWEGGAGKSNPAFAYCEAEDCIGNGGTAQCSKGVGSGDDDLGPDKWKFNVCDERNPQIAIDARWCRAAGGEWYVNNGYATCRNLPPGVTGGGGTATDNEAQIVATADEFARMTSSCATLSSDTGWGATVSSNFCWSGSTTTSALGVDTQSMRRRRYTTGECTGSSHLILTFMKTRGSKCPAGYKSRNAVTGAQCYLPGECCLKVGNPASPYSGTKFHEETDYRGPTIGGLELRRYYKSTGYYRPSGLTTDVPNPHEMVATEFWRTNYDRRVIGVTSNAEVLAVQQRADGSVRSFALNGNEVGNIEGGAARLQAVSGIGWDLTLATKDVERYSTAGQLMSITTRAGLVTTLTYDTCGLLSTVTDAFGHTLTFTNDCTKRRATAVTLPDSSQILYGYDSLNRPATVTYADGAARSYSYADPRNQWLLTGIQDESGQAFATYQYDATGRVTLSEHADHTNRYQFTYGTTTTVVDPLGATTQHGFSSSGGAFRKASHSQPCLDCGQAKAATYDAQGNPATRTDFNNVQTTFQYDPVRNLEITRTEAAGTPRARVISTTWHPTFRLPAQIERSGQRTGYTYDFAGNILTQTITDLASGDARSWTYSYDSYGRVLTEDGPRTDVADVTTYTYYSCSTGNECGQLHTIVNARSHTTTFNSYNAHGHPLTITDANGVVTTLTYDARQRLASRMAGTEQSSFEYWPTGLLKKTTLPDGSFLLYTYDAAQRLRRIDDSAGNYTSYTLDSVGNRTAQNVFDPAGVLAGKSKWMYNSFSRLWKEVGATGLPAVTTTFSYDGNGNQTSIDAPLARTTVNQYDELNRLKQTTDPGNGVSQFGYDGLDNLTSVTDPRGAVTSYLYNAFGDLRQLTSPDTGITVNTFTNAGSLATTTDARGKVGVYGYDALNRVTSLVYPDQTINFTYDAGSNGVGRLTGASDANHSLAWTYDALGRVVGKSQTVGVLSKSLSYAYTAGRQTRLTLPSGREVTYGYSNNRITRVSVDGVVVLDDVVYEPFGPVAGWTWGNGSITSRDYNLDGNTTAIQSAGTSSYNYDDAHRITAITDADVSARSWNYGYDKLDRLNSASKSGFSQGWTYDANGNRQAESGTAPSTYSVAPTSNRLATVSGSLSRTYTYADSGQVLSDTGRNFTYSDAGRLTAVSGTANATYLHNALGQRIRKTADGVTTHFMYDEGGRLIGEYDASGNLIQEIVWLGDIPVATLRDCSCGSSIFYIHTDHLNTPRKITKRSTTDVVWRWDSDPFGSATPNTDPDGDGTHFSFNLRFPGQYYDAELGSHYNYYRDYDPVTGRYVQSDPIGLNGGINTYAYVDSSPLMGFDPLGLQVVVSPGAVVGPAGAAGASGSQLGQVVMQGLKDLAEPLQNQCCINYANIYEANDKHGRVARPGPNGVISRLPFDGQGTLNTSIPVGSEMRLGRDSFNGELVLFRLHRTEEYPICKKYWHGYVVSVENLTAAQWRAGRDARFPKWPRKPR